MVVFPTYSWQNIDLFRMTSRTFFPLPLSIRPLCGRVCLHSKGQEGERAAYSFCRCLVLSYFVPCFAYFEKTNLKDFALNCRCHFVRRFPHLNFPLRERKSTEIKRRCFFRLWRPSGRKAKIKSSDSYYRSFFTIQYMQAYI